MNTVEPIRDINTVMDIADYLKSKNERDYVMFMFGIYTGLIGTADTHAHLCHNEGSGEVVFNGDAFSPLGAAAGQLLA